SSPPSKRFCPASKGLNEVSTSYPPSTFRSRPESRKKSMLVFHFFSPYSANGYSEPPSTATLSWSTSNICQSTSTRAVPITHRRGMYPSGLFVSAASGDCSLSVSEQPTAKISTARANNPRPRLERLPRKTITTEPTRKQHKIQQKPHTKQNRPPSHLLWLSMSKCA